MHQTGYWLPMPTPLSCCKITCPMAIWLAHASMPACWPQPSCNATRTAGRSAIFVSARYPACAASPADCSASCNAMRPDREPVYRWPCRATGPSWRTWLGIWVWPGTTWNSTQHCLGPVSAVLIRGAQRRTTPVSGHHEWQGHRLFSRIWFVLRARHSLLIQSAMTVTSTACRMTKTTNFVSSTATKTSLLHYAYMQNSGKLWS